MLRANGRVKRLLSAPAFDFLGHAGKSIERILPHVEVHGWEERLASNKDRSGAYWVGTGRREVRVSIVASVGDQLQVVNGFVRRKKVGSIPETTLDDREIDICKYVASRASEVLAEIKGGLGDESIKVLKKSFDEYVVARYLESVYRFSRISMVELFESLHTLSEQSYENKSIAFGCVLDSKKSGDLDSPSLKDFLRHKKYKALSDGYRTAYRIDSAGGVYSFFDLREFGDGGSKTYHYPSWAEDIAAASHDKRCGVVLSRHGDILIFEAGTLRFTYRFGRWQCWSHGYIVDLLKKTAKVQHVSKRVLGKVISSIYRASLDVSFRRSGGLFVLLRNRGSLPDIVRSGDEIGGEGRSDEDNVFDRVVSKSKIHSISQSVLVELASLDGSVVVNNVGDILAYGAVLQPKSKGRLQGTEGSRTKAAKGASNYGLAVKISSDGGITVYDKGKVFIEI